MPSPAIVSTNTSWPREVSSRTAGGVMPTRYSWFLISFGTPTRMGVSFSLVEPRENGAHAIHHAGYIGFRSNQRGGQRNRVARYAHDHIFFVEQSAHRVIAAKTDGFWIRLNVDTGCEPAIADVDDVRRVFQAVHRIFEHRFELARTREQVLVAIKIERHYARGTGERMTGIGVAVEQLDGVRRTLHERFVDFVAHDHAAHRHRAVGDT